MGQGERQTEEKKGERGGIRGESQALGSARRHGNSSEARRVADRQTHSLSRSQSLAMSLVQRLVDS